MDKYFKAINYDQWFRNPQWPSIPEDDNSGTKAYAIYAVFENQTNRANVSFSSGADVQWGDGSSDTMTGAELVHIYSYASISAPVITHPMGGNYKPVLVEITATSQSGVTHIYDFTRFTFNNNNFLDIVIYAGDGTTTFGTGACSYRLQYSHYLERFRCKYPQATNSANGYFSYCSSLRVFDVPSDLLNYTNNLGQIFFRSGNNCKIPCDIDNNTTILSQFAGQNHGLKFGNIEFTGSANFQNLMPFGSNMVVGNVTAPNITNAIAAFGGSIMSTIKKIGTIDMPALEDMTQMFRNGTLEEVVFTDCSSVTTTTLALEQCFNITKLIMPGLTVGIEANDGKMSADAIDDFFTSLGTASGTQTIDVSNNPGSATCDTSIATGKGFTVIT